MPPRPPPQPRCPRRLWPPTCRHLFPPNDQQDPGIVRMSRLSLVQLREEIVTCRRCPRLVAWREQVAREKRAAYRSEEYWGRPVPCFGDPAARVMICGLAP